MTGRTIEELAVGDVAEVAHAVTRETIREFVEASGDDNPIHSDPAFAASTRFGRVIAPGMLTGSFVSAVIGTRLPGPGTIYLSQSFRFLRPVFVGDRVTARVEVRERLAERNRLRLVTTCVNQDGELLLEGEAWVLPSKTRIEYAPAPSRSGSVPASPASWGPTALPLQMMATMMAWWTEDALALAGQTMRFWAGMRTAPRVRAAADPVRP